MKLLIKNIKGLVQAGEQLPPKRAGKDMSVLPVLENAWLYIIDGMITDYGTMDQYPDLDLVDVKVVDGTDRFVFPSYVDSHTHLVYAGSREHEFVMRIQGATYEEIAREGGGILNSALRLQQTSEEELLDSARQRLKEVIRSGTGALEIKSGYGLNTEAELKMLRVIRQLKHESPIPIKASFLGAHAYPMQYKENHEAYLNELIEQMMPRIADEGLADYIDVFCDRGFFSQAETERLLEAGAKYGLKPRIHANELDFSGGVQAGVKYHALSVDHLEHVGPEEIQLLLQSDTMPTLLPSTAFFLRLNYPPARQMIDAGLPVALASDYNPGSSPSGNMNFVLSLACIQLRMTPEEAINAATLNSAYSMEMSDNFGSIGRSKAANLFITEPIPSYSFIPYSYGSLKIEKIILNGEIWND